MSRQKSEGRESRLTHLKLIKNWLESKGSITPMEALGFGCYRLGARIYELRHDYGMKIETRRMPQESGEPYALYVLKETTLF